MNGGGAAEPPKTLKEGERILGPTRRPDGTLRKPIRIRAGYTPQDEVAIYQSKGSIWKKEMQEGPPGYDQEAELKPKSKSAKRNERKKEKRQQAALNKGNNSDQDDVLSADNSNNLQENVESTSIKMNGLSLSESASSASTPPTNSIECSPLEDQVQDIDKKIRALKKKIRITEAQQQKTSEADMKQEQLEKLAKLEGWRSELKLLEDKKSDVRASMSCCWCISHLCNSSLGSASGM